MALLAKRVSANRAPVKRTSTSSADEIRRTRSKMSAACTLVSIVDYGFPTHLNWGKGSGEVGSHPVDRVSTASPQILDFLNVVDLLGVLRWIPKMESYVIQVVQKCRSEEHT